MSLAQTLITADELLAMPGDDFRYELVKGKLIRMSPTGGEHGTIAAILTVIIGHFVREKNLGLSLVQKPDSKLQLSLIRFALPILLSSAGNEFPKAAFRKGTGLARQI